MKSKRWLICLKLLAALAGAAAAAFAGHWCAQRILAHAFESSGLTGENLADAPGYLRFAARNTGTLTMCVSMLVCIAALLFLRDMFGKTEVRFRVKWLALLIFAAVIGIGLVTILRNADEIRNAPQRSYGNAAEYALAALLPCALALLIRGCIYKGAKDAFGLWTALAVSAVAEGGLCLLIYGTSVPVFINGMIFSALACLVYESNASLWPEILLRFGFAAGARLLCGYPNGGAYYVSGSLWAGAEKGTEGSLTLTILLAMVCVFVYLYRRKQHG